MSSSTAGVCRFCGEQRELSRSHIVPEFLYRPLYDSQGRYQVIDARPGRAVSHPREIGIRERLLCGACEARFNREFEQPFQRVRYFQNDRVPLKRKKETKPPPLDYRTTKLFLLSMLWRASVATVDPFSRIDLGTDLEDDIRRRLESGEPRGPADLACLAMAIRRDGHQLVRDYIDCEDGVIGDQPGWAIVAGGFRWIFVRNGWLVPRVERRLVLQPDRRWVIMVRDFETDGFFERFAETLKRKGLLPR